MTIVIVFKNGYELKTKCKYVTTSRSNATGRITNLEFTGCSENKLIN